MDILKVVKMPEMLKNSHICPNCGSDNFYSSGSEAFCKNCSLLILEEE